MHKHQNDPSYSLSGFEKVINKTVHFFFFYRMLWVIGAIGAIAFFAILAWNKSLPQDQVKNLVTILTCGSIIIGIFYAVLNYEINYYKFKREQIHARKVASFQVAAEWHKDSMVNHMKVTKKLYELHGNLLNQNKTKEFSERVDADEQGRASLLSILNYLECISLGISEGIHDEAFMKAFFRGIFVSYLNEYEFYISYRRKINNNAKIWLKFTELATQWRA